MGKRWQDDPALGAAKWRWRLAGFLFPPLRSTHRWLVQKDMPILLVNAAWSPAECNSLITGLKDLTGMEITMAACEGMDRILFMGVREVHQ